MHYTVFVARMQPLTPGHLWVIRQALDQSDKLVIVLGSITSSRSIRNPFTYAERVQIIRSALSAAENDQVIITGVQDTVYNNNAWIEDVQRVVDQAIHDSGWQPEPVEISLIGHARDHTSFYLKMFPEWKSISLDAYCYRGPVGEKIEYTATAIRETIFSGKWLLSPVIATMTDLYVDTVYSLSQTPDFKLLREERRWLDSYWEEWGKGKQFNTVDSVVTLGGHILLVQRGGFPGKGQWALPGGFLNPNERIVDAAVRELHEETGLTVPEPVLYGSIDGHDSYDVPDRDPRGRIITHAYHFNMINYGGGGSSKSIRLPRIKGQDDAVKAKWVTLNEFTTIRPQVFSDHYDIAMDLISRATRKWN